MSGRIEIQIPRQPYSAVKFALECWVGISRLRCLTEFGFFVAKPYTLNYFKTAVEREGKWKLETARRNAVSFDIWWSEGFLRKLL